MGVKDIIMGYICLTWIKKFNNITMSKTKHPANMVLLTESEHFVHISALLILGLVYLCLYRTVSPSNPCMLCGFRIRKWLIHVHKL